MTIYKKKIYIIMLLGFSLLSVFWIISEKNSFCFDDTTWLLKVSTTSYQDLFSFIPHSAYLDRPIGVIFLKLLYDLFGLDYGYHHAVLIGLHIINTVLVFLVTQLLFEFKFRNNDKTFLGAVVTAGFFGIWPRTQMAVQWDAAIFDLLGVFLALLSCWFYLQYQKKNRYKGQNLVLTLFFYYLAIRTKEMFLVLPLLFMMFEIWRMLIEGRRRFSKAVLVGLFMMIFFLGVIFYCKMQGSITNDSQNPYYQSFNPVILFENLLRYCSLCFDMSNIGWNYAFSVSGLIGTAGILIGLVAAVFWAIRYHKFELLLCYIAIGISIVIVLPMVNQVHVLYLYFPSIFVGLLLAVILSGANVKIESVAVILLMIFCLFTNKAKGIVGTREYWLSIAELEDNVWNDIQEIKKPIADTTIYVINCDDLGYTPFFYGDGGVCKLLYHDETLSTILLSSDEEVEYKSPYVVWEYKNGHIEEVLRNESRTLEVQKVYVSYNDNEEMIVGVELDKYTPAMTIMIDGQKCNTVVGEGFISATIPKQYLINKEEITLTVVDQYETLSNEYQIDL